MEGTINLIEFGIFMVFFLIVLGIGIKIAYGKGWTDANDDRFEKDMKRYWEQQKMRKKLGLSYQVKGTYEVMESEE